VVLTEDENQKEMIAMGKGISFQKKVSDLINESLIDKRFLLESEENVHKMTELLSGIPPTYLEIADDIIHYGKKEINAELSKSIYIGLMDHLNFAIDRHKKGQDIKNTLIFEIKKLYPKEYKVGLYGILVINEKLGINLPEDEAGFIALHFLNAQQDSLNMSRTVEFTKMIQAIINIVQLFYKTTLDEDSMNYHRFVTHLRYLSYRIQNRDPVSQEGEKLFMQVKENYPLAYQCGLKINEYLKIKYHTELSKEELTYFMIHIQRVTSR
jgi:beta-glucoside operon transcriptional antiterminator